MNIIKYIFSVIFTIAIKFLFDWLYVNYVFKYYAYDTFRLDYDASNNLIGLVLVIFTTLSLHLLDKQNRSAKIPMFVLFLSLILPLSTILGYESMDIIYFLVIILCYNLIIIFLTSFPDFKVKFASNNLINLGVLIIILIYVYTYFLMIINGGIQRLNFNFEEIYETRALLSNQRFPFSGYFINWIGYSFNPILIVIGLYKKNKKILITGILLQLLLFGMTNYKSFLFSIPLLIVLYQIAKLKRHYLILLIGTSILLGSMFLHFLITKDFMLSSILIRRQFYVPAHLHFLYHDFFSRNPFVFLSDSIFENIINYPYQQAVTRVVSTEYYGRGFGTNVGFFGNAYYNFGYLGMFIFSLILAFILKFTISLDKYIPKELIATILLIPFMALINSGLLTSLLTHSLLITIISIWLYASYFNNRGGQNKSLSRNKRP